MDAAFDRHLERRRRPPAAVPAPVQNSPLDDPLVRLEMVAIRDHVLAAERTAAAHVLDSFEVHVGAAHAGDARAQHRHQRAGRPPRAPRREEAAQRVDLILLDVDQEHVGPVALRRSIENLASRLACSERMPSTKKQPSPTASRITRVWLPGRRRPITACRSGNQRVLRQRTDRADQRHGPARCSTQRDPAKPTETSAPTRSEAACHDATATSAALTATATPTCVQSMARHQRRTIRRPAVAARPRPAARRGRGAAAAA